MKGSRSFDCSRSRLKRSISCQRARISGSRLGRPARIGKSLRGRKTVDLYSGVMARFFRQARAGLVRDGLWDGGLRSGPACFFRLGPRETHGIRPKPTGDSLMPGSPWAAGSLIRPIGRWTPCVLMAPDLSQGPGEGQGKGLGGWVLVAQWRCPVSGGRATSLSSAEVGLQASPEIQALALLRGRQPLRNQPLPKGPFDGAGSSPGP